MMIYSRRNKKRCVHSVQSKRNAVEESLDDGFRAVRTETNKALDVLASNKESMKDGYEKVLAETKCELLRLINPCSLR